MFKKEILDALRMYSARKLHPASNVSIYFKNLPLQKCINTLNPVTTDERIKTFSLNDTTLRRYNFEWN